LGNMKRPVAASAAAEAAEKVPHASPIQARRVNSGEVSSAARVVAGAAAPVVAAFAAAPPCDTTVVVRPARSGPGAAGGRAGAAGGRGGAAGRAGGAVLCSAGFVSSAIPTLHKIGDLVTW